MIFYEFNIIKTKKGVQLPEHLFLKDFYCFTHSTFSTVYLSDLLSLAEQQMK